MDIAVINKLKNNFHLFDAEFIDKAEDDIFWKREYLGINLNNNESGSNNIQYFDYLYLIVAYMNYLSMKNSGKEFYCRYDDYQYKCKLGYMDIKTVIESINIALECFKEDKYTSTRNVLLTLKELIKEN